MGPIRKTPDSWETLDKPLRLVGKIWELRSAADIGATSMLVPLDYPFCSEMYIVEKTIHVVARVAGDDRQIRIEALHNPFGPIAYSTRSYIHERVANPAGEQAGKWVDYNLPWTSGSSADEALTKALSFLGERCPKK